MLCRRLWLDRIADGETVAQVNALDSFLHSFSNSLLPAPALLPAFSLGYCMCSWLSLGVLLASWQGLPDILRRRDVWVVFLLWVKAHLVRFGVFVALGRKR
ncbi:hypothetical protein K439DRAFT_876175 [Ramaria rubella]|nr:hypothetical protein K439DRAFT_876175 [Ramaria rubella]